MYTGLHDELPKEFCKVLGDEVMEIMKDIRLLKGLITK